MKTSNINGLIPQITILFLFPLFVIPMFFYWVFFLKKYNKIKVSA